MAAVVIGHRDDARSVQEIAAVFSSAYPGYRLGYARTDGEVQVAAPPDGASRVLWLDSGSCLAWVPSGHRTNEGDGEPLPAAYVPDALRPADHDALRSLQGALGHAHPRAARSLAGLASRYDGIAFRGEAAADLWGLLETGLPHDLWIEGTAGRAALEYLLLRYRELGWSTKREPGSFEPFRAGDQLLATAREPLRLRGACGYWWMDVPRANALPCASTRRLRYLKDTAGGCAPGFDAFRRLTLTWQPFSGTAERPDGVNVVNSHVVHIAADQSRTHYHPAGAVGGGLPQVEFYFVLARTDFGLHGGGPSALHIYPDIGDWTSAQSIALRPGSVVLIPPDTGHRCIDVLANVVTVPGFKPGNEIYVDAAIALQTAGKGIYNAAFAGDASQSARPSAALSGAAPAGARQ